jgi:hypothetical protein
MKRLFIVICAFLFLWTLVPMAGYGAYNHQNEIDSGKFLTVYPTKAHSKLDSCALCHKGGSYGGKTYGSCQYCHAVYGLTSTTHGLFSDTLNSYGLAYLNAGRSTTAVSSVESIDSDGDGYTNLAEIQATRYPGDASDDPTKIPAPSRVYTKAQLEALTQHTQFMMMSATRSDDGYAEYAGVPVKDLLDNAGILLDLATGIIAYSPDGFSWTHPLYPSAGQYHVYGNMTDDYQYPPATYFYNADADLALHPTGSNAGWCDWSAPGCTGRVEGDAIYVGDEGLKAILAIKHNGTDLTEGVLNSSNKLDGEGPFRLVVPQVVPTAPDQKSIASNSSRIWPYESAWDHNAGACTRSTTIIKVFPLPEGTTDIDLTEAGWTYVDQGKIIIYGAIDGSDSNGNGILDSEEGADDGVDSDGDTIPDYKDTDTAKPSNVKGAGSFIIHTSAGELVNVSNVLETDESVPTSGTPLVDSDNDGIPDYAMPFGVTGFTITGLNTGASVTLTLSLPLPVAATSRYFKVTDADGWKEVPHTKYTISASGSTITLTLTDGDPDTDADGVANGVIVDPGAVVVSSDSNTSDSDSGWCFIGAAGNAPMGISFGFFLCLCFAALQLCLGARRL